MLINIIKNILPNRSKLIRIGLVFVFILALSRLKRFVNPLWNNVFIQGVEWKNKFLDFAPNVDQFAFDWDQRFVWSFIVLLIWSLILFLLYKINRSKKINNYLLNFFSAIGWGILINLLLNLVGIPLNRYYTIMILSLTLLVHIIFKFIYPNDLRDIPKIKFNDLSSNWASFICFAIIVLLVWQLCNTFLWTTFMRGEPFGDELFGHSASQFLHQKGFTYYLSNFKTYNYDPAYPFISTLLLAFIPVKYFYFSSFSLAFIQGSFLILILLTIYNHLTIRQLSIYIIFQQLFLFSSLWIFGMLFFLWYGEAMAIAFLVLMFIALDPDTTSDTDKKSMIKIFFQLFGLGAILALGKPPTTKLLLVAIIPTIAILGIFYYKNKRSTFLIKIGFFFIGALIARLTWHGNLQAISGTEIYPMNLQDVLAWSTAFNVIKFFGTDYIHCWAPYIILVPIAILWDRKYLISILVSLGMMISILALYLLFWGDIEFMSGSRYILHGFYGWMFYFLAKNRSKISEIILYDLNMLLRLINKLRKKTKMESVSEL